VFAGIMALLLAACGRDLPYNGLNPAGPVADKQFELFTLVFWIAVVVFVLVEGLLVVALIRFRRRSADDTPKQVHGNTRLEMIWTVLPALLLAGVAVPTVGTIFDLAERPAGEVVEINVTGHQWWWEVEYPQLDVVTANEIHVPTDRPVVATLTSDDVIHSFWVPRLAGKQDLVPGRTSTLNFAAPNAGTYLGECAEFCGLSHALMLFRVVAESPSEFDAWVDGQLQGAAAPPTEVEQLVTNTCMSCHVIRGVESPLPPSQVPAPDLTHVGARQTIVAGLLDLNDENLARWLRNPPAVKPGSKMPNYHLTDDQIEALVAYLRSLQ
jgi:cytochrome c oxidase subunit II